MMDKQEIIKIGEILAQDLLTESDKYHIKSDHHDILGYESFEIKKIATGIDSGELESLTLQNSTLLSYWGGILAKEIPELFLRVQQYRALCETYLAKNQSI